MMHSPVPSEKQKEAELFALQVLEFVRNGGIIEICPPDPKLEGKVFRSIKVGYTETRFT